MGISAGFWEPADIEDLDEMGDGVGTQKLAVVNGGEGADVERA